MNAVPKYRMYVDEVGNADTESSEDPNHRYLSLTGVIFELSHVEKTVFPEIEEIKRRLFSSHPDNPTILHRKELVNRRPPFAALKDPMIEAEFNSWLLDALHRWDYTVLTVLLDKLEHKNQYAVWKYDPYHYCLKVITERYVLWLREHKRRGDVMAESRGGREDMRLKKSFRKMVDEGTEYLRAEELVRHLTSCELKVKPKANNIAGLQVADLVAHPSYRYLLAKKNAEAVPDNFCGRIAAILERDKYRKNRWTGKIEGWGIKWLP